MNELPRNYISKVQDCIPLLLNFQATGYRISSVKVAVCLSAECQWLGCKWSLSCWMNHHGVGNVSFLGLVDKVVKFLSLCPE